MIHYCYRFSIPQIFAVSGENRVFQHSCDFVLTVETARIDPTAVSGSKTFVIKVTDGPRGTCDSLKIVMGRKMANPSLLSAVRKLAIAGEQAGFTLEQMIELLDEGLSVQNLLELISWRLAERETPIASPARSSIWIV